MGIKRDAQIADGAVFIDNGFDNLLVKIAARFFAIQRQAVAHIDAFTRPGNPIAFVVINASIQNSAVAGKQAQHRVDAFFIWVF